MRNCDRSGEADGLGSRVVVCPVPHHPAASAWTATDLPQENEAEDYYEQYHQRGGTN